MRGIFIGGRAIISGNVACGNAVDLHITAGARVEMDDTNELCVVQDRRTE